jgi:hypothetical protein
MENGVPSNVEKIAFENDLYKVVVGYPPANREYPTPILSYLVTNKETGVVEYINSMFPYAKNMANDLEKVVKEGFPKEEAKDEAFPSKFR